MKPLASPPGLPLAAAASWLLLIYMATMTPGYTFEDTAILAAACSSLGVGHPPGYPLYVLTCAPFAQLASLAGFNVSQGAAFASALAAAAASVCIGVLAWRVCRSGPAALIACLGLGMSLTFWSQAVIPEVYALNCLLFAASLLVADIYVARPRRKWLLVLALLAGLGLANHWPLYIIAWPAVLAWLLPAAGQLARQLGRVSTLALLLGFFVAGLLPYLLLVLAPADSARFLGSRLPEDFFAYVARAHFAGFDASLQHPRWDQRLHSAGLTLWRLLGEQTIAGGLLGVVGLLVARRWLSRWRVLAVVWGLLGSTFVLALVRPYLAEDPGSTAIFRVYSLPALAMLSLLVALGLARYLNKWQPRGWLQWLPVPVWIALLAVVHLPAVDRSEDDLAMLYARELAASAPAGALILVGADSNDFPVAFRRFLDEDAAADPPAEVFQLYLDDRGDQPSFTELPAYLAREPRPVLLTPFVPLPYAAASFHGAFRLVPPQPDRHVALSGGARELLRRAAYLRERGVNVWTLRFADRLVFDFVSAAMIAAGSGGIGQQDAGLLAELAATGAGRYAVFLAAAVTPAGVVDIKRMRSLAEELGEIDDLPIDWQAQTRYLIAASQYQAGMFSEAIETLKDGLRRFPSASNKSVLVNLLGYYAYTGDFDSYERLRVRYPLLSDGNLSTLDAMCADNRRRDCVR